MSVDYLSVLSVLHGGKAWVLSGDDYDGLEWYEDSEKPSREELDSAWPEVRDALAWDVVRAERDRLLAGSDWTQVADAPVDKAAWAVYRQQLRDVPQDFASPDLVVWPTAP